jgi:hypothetical protein
MLILPVLPALTVLYPVRAGKRQEDYFERMEASGKKEQE